MDKDLARLQADLTAKLAGLDARQTQATPASRPENWSIQEIVEHLLLTWRLTIPAIQARIDKRSPTRATPTWQQRLGQFWTIRLGRFPHGRTAPAVVSPSMPASLRSGEELATRIKTELATLDQVTARAETMFGNRPAASHVILGPLSMQQWRRFHLVHGLHHGKQINDIRRDNTF